MTTDAPRGDKALYIIYDETDTSPKFDDFYSWYLTLHDRLELQILGGIRYANRRYGCK